MWEVNPEFSGAPVLASGMCGSIPEGKVKHRHWGWGMEGISCVWTLSGPLPGRRGQGLLIYVSKGRSYKISVKRLIWDFTLPTCAMG